MPQNNKNNKIMEIWLARDKNNYLFLFVGDKPIKVGSFWVGIKRGYVSVMLDEKEYPEVKWSDDEPTKVKLLIDK